MGDSFLIHRVKQIAWFKVDHGHILGFQGFEQLLANQIYASNPIGAIGVRRSVAKRAFQVVHDRQEDLDVISK